MKVAIIGSRSLNIYNLEHYIPLETTQIISGGAHGVDISARKYALEHNLKLTEFLPEYDKFGKSAPLKRNISIISTSDLVIAFWDGKSKGTKFVIDQCYKLSVPLKIILM